MVPEGWTKTHLKDILAEPIRNGYSPVASEKETGFWVLSLGALSDDGIKIAEIKSVKPTEKVLQSFLRIGDFLVSRSNTPDKVGRSIRFKGELENCSYPDLMMRFRVDETKADPAFIEHNLKSPTIRAYFKTCAAGSSNTMVKINKGILEKTPLLIPELLEQKKVAHTLSTWDRAISTTEELLVNCQQRKKALMQLLLTGKKRFPGFSEGWKEVKLSDLCQINPRKPDRPVNGRVSFIPMDAVSEDARIVRFYERNYEEVDKGFTSFQNNDVLIAKITPCFENGKGCYIDNLVNGVGFGSTEFHVLRAKANACGRFIYYVTNMAEFRIRGEMNMQGSAGQKRVSADFLKAYKVVAPPTVEEQQKIASILSAADREIETLQQKLGYLKHEKKSLMQQLLTGKRRVMIATRKGSERIQIAIDATHRNPISDRSDNPTKKAGV